MLRRGLLGALTLTWGCATGQHPEPSGPDQASVVAPPPGPPTTTPAPDVNPNPPPKSSRAAVIDDLPRALGKAKAEGKLVFVDAWATWCHTCLSMKHYVLTDPSFDSYAERMIFTELDADRDENAAFQEQYAVEVLPSFFVLDSSGAVLGMWPGSASVSELRGFLDGAIEVHEAGAELPASSPLKALVEARALHAASKHREAAKQYALALERAPKDWPRQSEALKGWLRSLARAGQAKECLKVGLEHLDEVSGASIPADFANQVLACAEALKQPATMRQTVQRVEARLTQLLGAPPAEMAPDDIADAYNILAYTRELKHDKAGAKQAVAQGAAVLEKAAAESKEPEIQATYDYGRAKAYVELGRADQAVEMLERREKQLPGSAEPPARLSQIYAQLGRSKQALAAVERAVKLAHGPRRLMYLERKSSYELKLGDVAAAVGTLELEVAGWSALSGKRARPKSLEAAEARLARAKAKLPR